MTDPVKSPYDRHPFDPNDHSHDNENSNPGNTTSPHLNVAWERHISFNTPPKEITEDASGMPGAPPGSEPDAEDFSINLQRVGTQVDSMLGVSRELVTEYETLRAKVLGSESTVFGQNTHARAQTYQGYTTFDSGYSDQPSGWVAPAKDFAAKMNPAQEKTLQSIGAALELVGEYIALVNHSGQIYAQADRSSYFPDPPPKGVTG
ncbi:hypothetical protein GCM10027176_00030 [Actinoallomurus bryophytorum]|uniref:Uncharacterized protein n=1 Tax=Actinoallomurus bryophytorum TaxID=1490222 RepID=A0A543CTS1_9ACTN|nr:hypothetical protein [Actinoallomurus bryophytorum]TQM00503.1 hypothetical protein FB559_6216 [Actinoallomurus bryophytorum]